MLTGSLNIVSVALLAVTGIAVYACQFYGATIGGCVLVGVAGLYVSASPRMVLEWNRGILLRLGKYDRVLPPGIVWIVPFVDQIAAMVDMRVRSTSFSAERTLTHDTVPVDVDAVMFWVVTDARRAVLEVERFRDTVSWAAQTTLRDIIGKTELVRMISDRQGLDNELQSVIDAKTSEWGVTVQSVEIRDVQLPSALEDAMSRRAQADREKEARVILAQSEVLVAEQMEKAAEVYAQSHSALQLRAMNMTYESIKEKGALMVVPSGMADSLNTGVIGMAAAGFQRGGNAS
jgi:regulator of protease activity HflC (stomatin/prohibitin superfamily)